jgi:aspartate kinase
VSKVDSSLIVCKFGGSSVADAGQFRKIKDIVTSDSRRKVVVVSAPGKRTPTETKLTDLYYACHDLALKGLDFSGPYQLIEARFKEIIADLGIKLSLQAELDELKEQLMKTPNEVSRDHLVSRGEYLCARIMAQFLDAEFVDAFDLIDLDPHMRVNAEGYKKIASRLHGNGLYVVPGFYGKSHQGKLKTFSRGGSDITGAILANALDAAMYENWTDVSGLLMADPRLIENPKAMPFVSFREIRELAYMGANVFHDEAIAPCKQKEIPVNIRNTNRPQDPGTIIGPAPEIPPNIVTGIAGKKNFAMIYLEKNMMNKEKGFGRKVLSILENYDVPYEHSPTGIDSMSIIVEQDALQDVEALVMEDFQKQLEPDSITLTKNLALIATVGHGMAQQVGVAARLFTALANQNVNIWVIDQGSSEINIIVGVHEKDYVVAIKSIYQAFVKEVA